jgi:hypothetical protein
MSEEVSHSNKTESTVLKYRWFYRIEEQALNGHNLQRWIPKLQTGVPVAFEFSSVTSCSSFITGHKYGK